MKYTRYPGPYWILISDNAAADTSHVSEMPIFCCQQPGGTGKDERVHAAVTLPAPEDAPPPE